jgi:hypothetical protein
MPAPCDEGAYGVQVLKVPENEAASAEFSAGKFAEMLRAGFWIYQIHTDIDFANHCH